MPDEETVGDGGADKDYGDPVQELNAIFQKTRGVTDICISGKNIKSNIYQFIYAQLWDVHLQIIITVMMIPLLGVPNIHDDINQKQFFARMWPVALNATFYIKTRLAFDRDKPR